MNGAPATKLTHLEQTHTPHNNGKDEWFNGASPKRRCFNSKLSILLVSFLQSHGNLGCWYYAKGLVQKANYAKLFA